MRVDLLEKLGAELRKMSRSSEPHTIDTITSWLGTNRQDTLNVVRELGFQVRSQPDGQIRLRRAR